MIKNLFFSGFRCLLNFLSIFIPFLVIASLYSIEAQRLDILPAMHMQSTNGLTLIFALLATLPLIVICFWSLLVRQELLIPTPRIHGTRFLIVVTKWRVAFVSAILSIIALRFL